MLKITFVSNALFGESTVLRCSCWRMHSYVTARIKLRSYTQNHSCKQCTDRWKHSFAMQLLKNAQLCNSTDKIKLRSAQSTPSVSEYVFFLLWGYWLSSLARIIWSWHSNSLSCLNDCLLRVETAQGLILKKPMLFCCRLMWSILLSLASLQRQATQREERESEQRPTVNRLICCQWTVATVLGSIPASVGTVELRGGRWSSVEYSTKKITPKNTLKKRWLTYRLW